MHGIPNYRIIAKYLGWKADDGQELFEVDKMTLNLYPCLFEHRPLACIVGTSVECRVGWIVVDPRPGLLNSDISLLLTTVMVHL